MKKLLLPLLVLSTVSLADGELFDFENAKPFGGEVKLNLDVTTTDFKKVGLKNYLQGEFKLYEFATIFGGVGYFHDGEVKPAPTIESDADGDSASESTAQASTTVYDSTTNLDKSKTFLGARFDFKEYGTAEAKYAFDKKFTLTYKNKLDLSGIETKVKAEYTLDHSGTALSHSILANSELKYDIFDNLSVLGKVELTSPLVQDGLDFTVYGDAGVKYTNIVELMTKLGVKYHEDTVLDVTSTSHVLYDYKGVENLRVTPKAEVKFEYSKYANKEVKNNFALTLTPSVEAEYQILDGLSLKSKLSSDIVSSTNNTDSKFKYDHTDVKLETGLKYTW